MSDLTDRLRNHSKCAEEEFGHPAEELLEWQAADRIEHLEAALTRISMMEGESEPRNKRFYRDFARAALK